MAKAKKGARQNQGQVRIIGGSWRGRRLRVLDHEGLRPSGDRVRETLFNWLQFDLPGAVCLDAFAGTGALGAEALSRGAKQVIMLEREPRVAHNLSQQLTELAGASLSVECVDALIWLQSPARERFDLVFLDPPFVMNLLSQTAQSLESGGWLSPTALIYVEYARQLARPVLPENWMMLKEKQTQEVVYALYQRSDKPSFGSDRV